MKSKLLLLLIPIFISSCDSSNLFTPEKNHTHSFLVADTCQEYLKSPASCTEPAQYYYSCECGEKGTATFSYGTALGHSFTNYIYNNDATHFSNGTETAQCDRCQEKNTREVFNTKIEHVFNKKVVTNEYLKSPASCVEPAQYYYSCECGEKGIATFSDGTALGHSFTNYIYNNDATHFSDGTETAICDRCFQKHTRTKPNSRILQHEFNKQVVKPMYLHSPATCTEPAQYYYSCECGEKGTNTFYNGEPLGHLFIDYAKFSDATCAENELERSFCERCNEVDIREIINTKTGVHSYTGKLINPNYLKSEATCCSPAVYYYSCEHCGEKSNSTFYYGNDLGGHKYLNGKCQVCGISDNYFNGKSFGELLIHTMLNESFVLKCNNSVLDNIECKNGFYIQKGVNYGLMFTKFNSFVVKSYINECEIDDQKIMRVKSISPEYIEDLFKVRACNANSFSYRGSLYDIFEFLFSSSYYINSNGVIVSKISDDYSILTQIKDGKIQKVNINNGASLVEFLYDEEQSFNSAVIEDSDYRITENEIRTKNDDFIKVDVESKTIRILQKIHDNTTEILFDDLDQVSSIKTTYTSGDFAYHFYSREDKNTYTVSYVTSYNENYFEKQRIVLDCFGYKESVEFYSSDKHVLHKCYNSYMDGTIPEIEDFIFDDEKNEFVKSKYTYKILFNSVPGNILYSYASKYNCVFNYDKNIDKYVLDRYTEYEYYDSGRVKSETTFEMIDDIYLDDFETCYNNLRMLTINFDNLSKRLLSSNCQKEDFTRIYSKNITYADDYLSFVEETRLEDDNINVRECFYSDVINDYVPSYEKCYCDGIAHVYYYYYEMNDDKYGRYVDSFTDHYYEVYDFETQTWVKKDS